MTPRALRAGVAAPPRGGVTLEPRGFLSLAPPRSGRSARVAGRAGKCRRPRRLAACRRGGPRGPGPRVRPQPPLRAPRPAPGRGCCPPRAITALCRAPCSGEGLTDPHRPLWGSLRAAPIAAVSPGLHGSASWPAPSLSRPVPSCPSSPLSSFLSPSPPPSRAHHPHLHPIPVPISIPFPHFPSPSPPLPPSLPPSIPSPVSSSLYPSHTPHPHHSHPHPILISPIPI